jgi:hypothetical protein
MKRKYFFLTILMAIKLFSFAQVGINATNTAPNGSAMLDVSSTNKGLLIPRMTTIQKNAIPNKIEGLTVYDTDLKQFSYWTINGAIGSWNNFGAGSSGGSSTWSLIGNDISNTNTGNVFIGPGINTANARLYVKKGNAGSTALFEGSSLTSAFNYGENEDTYIRGGKSGSHVTINDGTLGNVGIGPIVHPTLGTNEPRLARLMVADGAFGTTYTSAMFGANYRGISLTFDNPSIGFNSYYSSAPYNPRSIQSGHGRNIEMYPNGTLAFQYFGQASSGLYAFPIVGYQMAIQANGNVGIGATGTENARLHITKGEALGTGNGTLAIEGTTFTSAFHYSTLEDTYIRGGKAGSNVVINDATNGKVGIGRYPITHKLEVAGDFKLEGSDFFMGPVAGRGNGGRALVLDNNNMLSINYANDFSGGTFINSNVGVGTLPNLIYKLSVNGTIRSKELIVESGWADYVFDEKYKLRSIRDLEEFVIKNKHLPNIPKATDIENNGLKVAETNKFMMEKIEEMALYIIQLNKKIENLEAEIGKSKKEK